MLEEMNAQKHTFKVFISIHAKWKKPWFKEGYTEYTVVRETIRYYTGIDGWSRDTMTTLLKTKDFETATKFKADMLAAGVTTA